MAKVNSKGLNPTINSDQCFVVGAHAFVLKVSSFFGLAPLTYKPHLNGYNISVSIPMCMYSYLLITSLVALTLFGLISEMNFGISPYVHMTSNLSQIISCCDNMIVVIVGSIGVYGAPVRMRKMIEFMNILALVDKSIGNQYSIAKERKLRAGFIFFMFCYTAMMIIQLTYSTLEAKVVNREWDMVTNYFGFFIMWFFIIMLQLQFTYTAIVVNARFEAVNEALSFIDKYLSESYIDKENLESMSIFTIRTPPANVISEKINIPFVRRSETGELRLLLSPSDAVHHIALLHGKLCDVVRSFENSFRLSLIFVLTSIMFHLVSTPYFSILEINVKVLHHLMTFILLQTTWCGIHLLTLFMVVEPCHYTTNEGYKTKKLVCHMMLVSPTKGTLASRLEQFSRQLMLQPVCYKPMGACTLDRPLVASIFGAVTTYLVILIQFQKYES